MPQALAGIGLEPISISRDDEFLVATARIGGDTISRIEDMMGRRDAVLVE